MVADGMLTRKRYREVPPRVDYELTERARDLMPVLGELARWGYVWAWSEPRAKERVEIGAIFRLAPGLLHAARPVRGSVELTVTDAKQGGGAASYVVSSSNGKVKVEERSAPEADARVAGTVSAWVRAFAPEGDQSELMVSGDRTLAGQILEGLALSEAYAAGAVA
jgi:hypothetical protein